MSGTLVDGKRGRNQPLGVSSRKTCSPCWRVVVLRMAFRPCWERQGHRGGMGTMSPFHPGVGAVAQSG